MSAEQPPRLRVRVRVARSADGEHLAEIDRLTWSHRVTPQRRGLAGARFAAGDFDPGGVLVAEFDGAIVGYVQLGPPTPLSSHRHVVEIRGLAVLPAQRRRGIARELLVAGLRMARDAGARRATLRVLATNPQARALYESLGFRLEGTLRAEFCLHGNYVDDLLMAAFL